MTDTRRLVLPPAQPSGRRRAGVLAASLIGGIAGLAAGATCVAWPPERGQALPPSASARHVPPVAQGVAAVLVPAAPADVGPPGRRDEADRP